jgi:2-(3-amino-3-carboxypropyl)histidine synthase
MEDDRAATNLGPETDPGMPEEAVPVPKQPKRRFVGRKTAEKTSDQQADPNANIEDSSAIQGVRNPYRVDSLSDIANTPKSLNLAVLLVP